LKAPVPLDPAYKPPQVAGGPTGKPNQRTATDPELHWHLDEVVRVLTT
jgi:hypothetical protein